MDRVTSQKQSWQEPTVIEYGDVVQITQQTKEFGLGDGYILQIVPGITVPIRNAS
jgi:hypothetical protein